MGDDVRQYGSHKVTNLTVACGNECVCHVADELVTSATFISDYVAMTLRGGYDTCTTDLMSLSAYHIIVNYYIIPYILIENRSFLC